MKMMQVVPRLVIAMLAVAVVGCSPKSEPAAAAPAAQPTQVTQQVVLPVAPAAPAPVIYAPAPQPVYVQVAEAPPTEVVVDVQPAQPSAAYVWTAGSWGWNGHKYDWHHGEWTLPPAGFAVWVAPRYEHRAEGHFFAAGFWQPGASHGDHQDNDHRDNRDKADDHGRK